jgi:hypothetical protein
MISSALDSTPIGGDGHPALDPASGHVLLWRGPCASTALRWRPGQSESIGATASWRQGTPGIRSSRLPWRPAEASVRTVPIGIRQAASAAMTLALPWRIAVQVAYLIAPGWRGTASERAAAPVRWGIAGMAAAPAQCRWLSLRGAGMVVDLAFAPAAPVAANWEARWRPAHPIQRAKAARWRAAHGIPWGKPVVIVVPPPGGGDGGRDPRGPWVIFLRRTYMLFHDIALFRVSDGAEIPVSSIEFGEDAASPHLTFSATLAGASALPLVRPDANGEPVILECQIDGMTFRVLVERIPEGLKPLGYTVPIAGRSLSALLAPPYRLPTDRVSETAASVGQLAAAELPADGWALSWEAPDWTVPAGAWGLRNASPIAAIQRLAEASGAVVIASRTSQALTVRSCYPIAPWDYAGATPNLIVPYGALLEGSSREPAAPLARSNAANGIYLYGGNVGGALGRVYREISDGARLLADVQDDLLTDAVGLYARGVRELARGYGPDYPSIVLPLGGGSFPLPELGWLVRVDHPELGPSFGTVSGIKWGVKLKAVGVGKPPERMVTQSIRLGEDSGNALAAFRALMPTEPRLRGTVVSLAGDGLAVVQLAGGGRQMILLGGVAAGVGDAVWCRGGAAIGTAPTMTEYDIPV